MFTTECTLVDRIHKTPARGVIIPTGGGTGIFATILKRGGGSATLISGRIPYAEAETIEILGGKPDKYVSEQTTRQLAMAAYQMALKNRQGTEPVFGVASSSSLQKTPSERVGRVHYIYAALQTATKTVSLVLTIHDAKTMTRSDTAEIIRVTEERFNEHMLLNLIAEACGIEDRIYLGYGADFAISRTESTIDIPGFVDLMEGRKDYIVINSSTMQVEDDLEIGQYDFIFPGSFNPAHEAHFEMADQTSKLGLCYFEISIRNADKPVIDFISLESRLRSLRNNLVVLTNAPLFIDKSLLFPGATFVVGFDTACRIVDPKYADLDAVMTTFEANETTFMVFGREIDGKYECDLRKLSPRFLSRANIVPEPLKHVGLSSTDIRRQTGAGKSTD